MNAQLRLRSGKTLGRNDEVTNSIQAANVDRLDRPQAF